MTSTETTDSPAVNTTPNVVTLDHFRAAAAAKHGDLKIPLDDTTTVTLQKAMRLPVEQRTALRDAEKRMEAARKEPREITTARRELRDAQDRLDGLSEEQQKNRRVVREHERRVAEADDHLHDMIDAHAPDEIEQVSEIVAGVRDLVRAVADTRPGAEALIEAVGEDFYVLQGILEKWRRQTGADTGEASPSPS